ncbi:MAG: energy transducer TonB [Pseudomonadota bacterium]
MNQSASESNDRLLLAVVVASALHAMVIFGVGFDALRSRTDFRQVEVTLVQNRTRAPRDADHIAQANQRGSGSEAQRNTPSAAPAALPQPTTAVATAARMSQGRERLAAPVVTTLDAGKKIVDRRGERPDDVDQRATEEELARLNRELARLEASLDEARDGNSANPRIRRLDAVSARAAVDAAYLAEWRKRVEAVGNQYYPEASLRYGIFGSLRLLVTVRSSGDLEDIRVLKPSGQAVLDEAAIRILRMAAPFPPFPDELRETTDKLEIVRTWQFEENPLSSQ